MSGVDPVPWSDGTVTGGVACVSDPVVVVLVDPVVVSVVGTLSVGSTGSTTMGAVVVDDELEVVGSGAVTFVSGVEVTGVDVLVFESEFVVVVGGGFDVA